MITVACRLLNLVFDDVLGLLWLLLAICILFLVFTFLFFAFLVTLLRTRVASVTNIGLFVPLNYSVEQSSLFNWFRGPFGLRSFDGVTMLIELLGLWGVWSLAILSFESIGLLRQAWKSSINANLDATSFVDTR